MNETLDLFARFGTALAIGLMIGLQREVAWFRETGESEETSSDDLFAGARTFSMLSLLGCAGALAAERLGAPWVFAALLLVVGALVAAAYFQEAIEGDPGLTTEVAAVLTLLIGALCQRGSLSLAAALGVVTTALLALKLHTRSLARSVSREDVYATLKFAAISLVVLPLLPREGFGPPPFDVLVPYEIWLMVVFISGISFLGYVLIQIVGPRRGVGLTGLLGGLASSTAVTLAFTQKSRSSPGLSGPFALAILIAWCIMFVRVLVEVAVVNRSLLGDVWLPITAALVACLAWGGALWFRSRNGDADEEDPSEFRNPFELGPALTFGGLYAVILLAAHSAQRYLGETGLYASAVLSGLADVDAITLSMARLSQGEEGGRGVELTVAARSVVLAAVSNTVVKGGLVLSTGSPGLRRAILPGLLLVLGVALGLTFTIG